MIAGATEIHEIVDDLISVLKSGTDDLIIRYDLEPSPFELEFYYNPNEFNRETKEEEKTADHAVKPAPRLNAEPNYRCSDCSSRMYPVKKFYRPGKSPVLLLHYNGSVDEKLKPDRSDKFIFGSKEEDDLFGRMCSASGIEPGDFHFQEFPACHFAFRENSEEEWSIRAKNCLSHVIHTVKKNNIEIIIFTGLSAQIYFGRKKAMEKFQSMDLFNPEIDGLDLKAMVMRSPASLLALENKRKKLKDKDHSEILDEERRIKTLILESIKKIFGELKQR